ncbi:N-acetyl-alpha-D-glucosaminyl L-malate synthase [Gammaproteobacteria bacterium]|nr:glycosyltransferase [Gammaproteobacteria bacterium]CAG0938092.1 N-acetyl-alpha-D-glucosaminyl L-malate synthase [Gammaproteobacteria bacterium]
MRILFLTPSLGTGGAERQLLQLVCRLDPRRYQITVAAFGDEGRAAGRGFYADMLALPHVSLRFLGRSGRYDLLGPLLRLMRLLREQRIDVMHSFLNLASMFGMVAGRLGGVPIVASAIRDSRDISVIYRCCRIAEAWGCDYLVSNSQAGFDNRFKHRRANFRVIGNGLDMSRFARRAGMEERLVAELQLGRFRQLVGMVATLSVLKDHEAFLSVAARVVAARPGTGFLVIGDGPKRAELEALVDRLGLREHVVFAGHRDDVDALTGMLDVACLFTNFRVITEGLPNAVMEAMACGVPVVATRGGGTPELMTDGVEGFLVTDNDVAESTARVLALLEDETLRRDMGEKGRQRAQTQFSLDACVAAYEELYANLLPGR